MKLVITLEDTVEGISALVDSCENGVTDSVQQSLAMIVVANWAEALRKLEKQHCLVVDKTTYTG